MKRSKNKLIDMGWGSPDFLKPAWGAPSINVVPPLPMHYIYGGVQPLKDYISQLHTKVKNAKIKNKHILVTNGAGQAIQAIIYALTEKYITFTTAKAPHFSRFSFYSKLGGTSFVPDSQRHLFGDLIELITVPNNPDGNRRYKQTSKLAIYDLTYNWPTFGPVKEFDKPLMVFTLSKCSGFASTRIGWAIIEDPELYKLAEKYVEYSTGGISIHSQYEACDIIKTIIDTDGKVFKYGRQVLKERWKKVGELSPPFEIINKSGQFLWCKGKKPNFLKGLEGSKFGVTDEYFRLNLGVSREIFEEFYAAFKRRNK